MAKLVVLSAGLTGVSYELKTDKTTVGRVEDNTFQIAQASISSHHCEVLLRGTEVVVKDLNSTNGTFINNQQITGEATLKPGQTLRLGEVELKLDTGAGGSASDVSHAGTASAPASSPKRAMDSTMVINKGVSLQQLEQGPTGFDTTKGVFTKKRNKTNLTFIIIGAVLLVVILIAVYLAYTALNQPHK